jgi:hypothetical protein
MVARPILAADFLRVGKEVRYLDDSAVMASAWRSARSHGRPTAVRLHGRFADAGGFPRPSASLAVFS